jgi:S1-C subfamily serine protease
LILSFAGENPKNFEELTQVIAKYQPGDEVELQLYRGDGREKMKITLGEWE